MNLTKYCKQGSGEVNSPSTNFRNNIKQEILRKSVLLR